ncbi:MAG: DDE-type integrase/transposase/recombinase [Lacunisphaera sp.]|nr:DDE-type integrase/transposase/recombinase [Lacunisphaera sp.]
MQKVSEYLKLRVLAAIDLAEGRSIRDRIRAVAARGFADEQGREHRFTWRTIETWRVRYHKHGFTASGGRRDKGTFRKAEPEAVQEAVDQARARLRPGFRLSQLYRTCIEQGLLRREQIAPNTFRRMVRRYDMLKPDAEAASKERLCFAKRFANQMWQADTLVGPFVTEAGTPRQSRLIAFLDDASRVCCHGQFFCEENHATLKTALRAALYKRGIPQSLYVDNGSVYAGKDLTVVCGRLGCLLCHTPVRDAAAKGKIERFFRTVREQFLCRQLDLSSLAALNAQFTRWVEDEYHDTLHSALGLKPVDRFALDIARIRYLAPGQANDELFYSEATRTVKADNTFSFAGRRYEAPRDVRSRAILVRHDPGDAAAPLIVYLGADRLGEARPLDPVGNDRAPAQGGAL